MIYGGLIHPVWAGQHALEVGADRPLRAQRLADVLRPDTWHKKAGLGARPLVLVPAPAPAAGSLRQAEDLAPGASPARVRTGVSTTRSTSPE